ncbi:MAG: hypothetical protein GWO02_02855, partial [Gammaproteobacteria bacterium]|nr:hypothetical protein [Gammaproteobacteria bacterium]
MSACCHADITDRHFGPDRARRQVEDYRANGPDRITRLALAQLREHAAPTAGLLDVGGGF